jgi:hypothetical protein
MIAVRVIHMAKGLSWKQGERTSTCAPSSAPAPRPAA